MTTAVHVIPRNMLFDSAEMLGLPLLEIKEVNCEEIKVAIIEAIVRSMLLVFYN